jgi:uroporphyrinogen-III synthase/uroporphyrinogen III methyltransferase/synthase
MASLDGRRIVVTRRKGQASSLVDRLRELGALVLEVPAIEIAPPVDPGPLDAAVSALDQYDWIVLTSTNAVGALLARLTVLGLYPRLGGRRTKLASVGPATTAALRASFPEDRVALEPERDFRAGGLLAAFAERDLAGKRVLVPSSTAGRDELPAGLRRLGAQVEVVAAYATIEPAGLDAAVATCLADGFDLALFASPSAVEAFARAAGERASGLPVAVIGPTTEAAARAAGLDVRGVASPSTVEALIQTAERLLARPRS